MVHNSQDILASLLDAAKRAGADAADALFVENVSASVSYRLGKLEDVERSESADLGLRVFLGNRVAFVSSTDFSKDALSGLPERAIAMAKLAPEDKYAGLAPQDRLAKEIPALDLEDTEEPAPEILVERARTAENSGMAVKGVTNSEGGGASFSRAAVALATSHGFYGRYAGTSHSIGVSMLAGEGVGMERDYDQASARHAGDLRSADEIGRRAGELAVRRLNPRKVKSQSVTVVFDERESAGLIGHFAGAISGAAIARGVSFLKDKMGEEIFGQNISIIDDPHRVRGLRSKPFDGEGVANQRRALIENGRLTSWLLDCASARQLGLETTGHAARGTGGPPHPQTTNLYMAPGTLSREELIADIDQGFYVTELMGMGVNGVTGDYSRGAAGFWIEKGQIAFPVSEVTIAGNLKDMFRNLTPASDLVFRYGSNAPTLRIEGMTIAGHDDLALLESAVHAAGTIARSYYGGDYKRWNKAGGSPVTEADLAVDAFLKQTLLAARPAYGWLSEESVDNQARLTAAKVFVVDPIDGTVAFLKNRPHFTICAAVVEAGRPHAAVVYNPITEQCFTARRGCGAHLNSAPMHVSDRDRIVGARMLGPKNTFAEGWPEMELTALSSIAYRVALVAAGQHDAMVSLSVKRDWDLAAADLIVHESGGLLSDEIGSKLIYNRASATQRASIAAGPHLHALLLAHLASSSEAVGH